MKLIPLEKASEDKSDKTVVYHTQAVTTNTIENIKERLGTIMNSATFISSTKEEPPSHGMAVLHSEKVTLLPTYKGR